VDSREPVEPRVDGTIDAELEFHFAETVESLVERGWSESAARVEAARRFGDRARYRRDLEKIGRRRWWRGTRNDEDFAQVARTQQQFHESRRVMWLDDAQRDVCHALRTLVKNRGFTLVAVLTLALGIGANTAIFSVLDAVLLRPLPYTRPSELVAFSPVRYDAFREWTEGLHSLEVSGAYTYSLANVTGGGEPVRVSTLAVTSSLLPTLGVAPALGRGFSADDALPQATPRVLLRHGFWKSQFGGDASLVGRTIEMNGRPHEVIGILPASLEFPPPARRGDGSMPSNADVWTGVGWLSDLHERGGFYAVGRLAPGSSAAIVAAELSAAANSSPAAGREPSPVVVQRVDEIVAAPLRPAVLAFTAAVALLLLIACANLGSLLLVRLAARQRELAVRVSLGASPGRILRQILTESSVLAFGGATAGVGLAWLGLRLLLALAPPELARVQYATLNARVLAVTLALALVTALLIGLLPAWRAMVRDPHDDLGSMRGMTAARGTTRVHGTLVACEVAFAVVLLIGGGLLLRSFAALASVSPGFQAEGLVTADILLPPDRYPSRAAVLQFYDRLEERLAALPSARSVSAIDRLPYGPSSSEISFRIVGRPPAIRSGEPRGFNTAARPGYFQTMGIPMLQGREFTVQDHVASRPVVVIGGALAERYWPGASPLGARIIVFGVEREIVGVAGDVRHFGPATPLDPMVYLPQAQDIATRRMMTLVVRVSGTADALLPTVRAGIRDLDVQLPISNLRSFGRLRSERTASQRFNALLVASFAVVAVMLAAVGIYGVMSFIVAQRIREIGLRMALGATRSGVLALVVSRASRPVIVGIAVGLSVAFVLTRVLKSMLFGVTASDAVTFTSAALVLGAAAIAACLVPAVRAVRIDPIRALRHE
jgi:putative ABC transport system permease protein